MRTGTGILAVATLAAVPTAVGMMLLPTLPSRVPTHWGINGQPDGFGSASTFVFTLAAVTYLIGVLCIAISFSPAVRQNLSAYWRIATAAMAGSAVLVTMPMLKGAGWNVAVVPVMFTVSGVMLALMGGSMGNLKRNLWVGIRTPWTMTNDVVWERTHRVGAKLLVAWGLAVALAGLALPIWIGCVLIVVGALGLTGWAMIYSYRISRQVGHV